jgi:hypothetical protein
MHSTIIFPTLKGLDRAGTLLIPALGNLIDTSWTNDRFYATKQMKTATIGIRKMKIIATWHCTEILEGEERERTPREWLILAGPGEDVIFEVKSTPRRTNEPVASTARH